MGEVRRSTAMPSAADGDNYANYFSNVVTDESLRDMNQRGRESGKKLKSYRRGKSDVMSIPKQPLSCQ